MRRELEPEREFTRRDWTALYLAWRLFSQVAIHGAPALDRFLEAMCERDKR